MNDRHWQRAKEIFAGALEKAEAERAQFIAAACGDDVELRDDVRALLEAHASAGSFLAAPTGAHGGVRVDAVASLSADGLESSGSRIGPYKLLQVIGEGGFGVVYMAEQEQPIRRRVALKVIKLGMDTKEVIARFEAERQALALMEHPNIAKVLDAGATESGRPYFVMELVKGVPITEYSDTNQLSTRERLELFVDVCKAVHHAHEKGVIHRDIKPSNVLVTLHDGTPVPKVIDFGIAKAMNQPLTEKTLFTAFGEFVGTPWCMSPEQAALGGLEIDRRCDVYALGVLLYELLTGTTPFEPASLRSRAFFEIVRIIREEDPPTPSARLDTLGQRLAGVASRRHSDPRALRKMLRGDLDWIVMKAMEKDRRRRYGSAVDLAADVTRFFRSEPVVARKPSAGYRTVKFARRNRRSLLAAGLVVAAAIAGGASARFGKAASAGLPLIEPRLTRVIGSDTLRILRAGLSPDGRWIAFTTKSGASDWTGPLWVVPVEGGEPPRLITAANAVLSSWFPDGNRIAYLADGAEQAIMTVAFDSRRGQPAGPPQTIATGAFQVGPRVSPDGQWIAFVRWDDDQDERASDSVLTWPRSLRVIPAGGGAERIVFYARSDLRLVDWSVDGQYLYYAHNARGDGLRPFRIAVTGGTPLEVRNRPSGPSAPRAPYRMTNAPDTRSERVSLQVETYPHRPLARVALPQGSRAAYWDAFSSDGHRVVAVASGSVDAMRIVGIAGGTPRQVAEARSGQDLLGWSADGRDLLIGTRIEGRSVILRVSTATGAAHEVGPRPEGLPRRGRITFSTDGRHLAYSRSNPQEAHGTLVIRPAAGGEERIITRRGHQGWTLTGPGGTDGVAGPEFLYEERDGDRVLLRAVAPNGNPRLLRTFSSSEARVAKSVFGSRVAFKARRASIMVALDAESPAKEVANLPGVLGYDDIVWSPDGSWLAATAYVGQSTRNYVIKVLVVGVAPDGEVFAPARLIDTPIADHTYSAQWLPDGSAVALVGERPAASRTGVWLVPVHGQESPFELTNLEQDDLDDFLLSPDGQSIAYQAYQERGSAIWLADMGDALVRLARR